MPASVPPDPTAQMNPSTLPSVWAQISGPVPPGPLGVADHVERGPVLDRLARVHEFGLGQDLAAGQLAGAAQADQGRVPDGVEKAHGDRHAGYLVAAAALA